MTLNRSNLIDLVIWIYGKVYLYFSRWNKIIIPDENRELLHIVNRYKG